MNPEPVRSTSRRLRLLALLPLVLGIGACPFPAEFGLPNFAFEQPTFGKLELGDSVQFVLKLPMSSSGDNLTVWLDGEALSPDTWEQNGTEVRGTLTDLNAGHHTLQARVGLPVLSIVEFSLRAWTVFETGVEASFDVRPSIEQLMITHAEPDTEIEVYNGAGEMVDSGITDYQGSLIFRLLEPGDGYEVMTTVFPRQLAGPFTVMSVENSLPEQEFYSNQVLEEGFTYIETRDGTKLSAYVYLPGPPEEGPYPTIVNYSGYSPSKPGSQLNIGELVSLCGILPVLCKELPDHPSGLIAAFLMDYASVGVNMRGTGCSGGAYDFFEPLQVTDGYDIIEAVAAQDWVAHNQVGMAGLSYPGISQLFVASAQPPSLSAITPLSVIATTPSVALPGGILNDGFAVEWASAVLDGAEPYGRGWEQDVVDAGDTICEENQLLHSQKVDTVEKLRNTPFYVPEIVDPLNPELFVDQIQVPVFTAGSWVDEQTGGYFPSMWDRFTGSPHARFTAYNGAHADGYTPELLVEWKTFLDFYVAKEIRPVNPLVLIAAPLLFDAIFSGIIPIPDERFADFDSLEEALAVYEAEDPVRILFERGGVPETLGAPQAVFERSFPSWPPPTTEGQRWYFQDDGSMSLEMPTLAGESGSSFNHDPEKGQETFDVNDSFEKTLPDIQWLPWVEGRQAVFVSPELTESTVVLGFASVDLWIQSNATDADLEVVISEIRPDGQEMYVQSGWQRASLRALAPGATDFRPIKTGFESDREELVPGEWTEVRVEMYPTAHVFRPGSRIKVSVEGPGGNRGRWKFDTVSFEFDVEHAVGHSAAHPSSILLPVVPGLDPPAELPECPSLRSQPCREYVEHVNTLLE